MKKIHQQKSCLSTAALITWKYFCCQETFEEIFSPQVLICWQLLLCVHVAQKIACMAHRHYIATVISWSLAHYRVTTVWLRVEADRTTLGKCCGEDCGFEGSCPHVDWLFGRVREVLLRMFSEMFKKGVLKSSKLSS